VGYPFVRSGLVMTGYIQYKPDELLRRNGFDWRTAETEHFFLEQNQLLPLSRLIKRFRFEKMQITYPEAGSFVRFFMSNMGGQKSDCFGSKGKIL